ncbi:patellin-3-like [Phalaenopsis equestris]|uniref:patellin-3-like n=1 Tax=Phalaenopsis equestris TaxID=78828 RepID=UPI0009E19D4C|nr:patellin-3-like [Phalaenopsis equestris]
MAEETEKKASDSSPAEGVVVSEAKTGEKDPPVVAAKVTEEETKKPTEEAPAAVASVSFKEESNLVGDLPEPEKKALDELKQLVQAALSNNEFNPPPPPPPPPPKSEEPPASEAKVEEPAAAEQTSAAQEKAEVTAPAEHKAEETAAHTSEEPAVAPSDAPKVVESVEIKTVVVDDDGAKTVEAIEETVVPVTPPAPVVEAVAPTAETGTDKEPIKEPEAAASVEAPPVVTPAEEFIWGVPLVGDEKSDTVLLKFLRARDFKVKDALAMIKNAVIWRKQFGIESLLEEDLEVPELEKVVFYHGQDKEGHPVCYNVYGEFQDPELYAKAFGDEEKREKFLRWRIQFLEKGIRQQLDFSPKGVCTMVQITDLKNVPGPGKKELRQATKKALALLQDNYPEFVAKQVFINVPWWYLAYNRVISPFFTQRSKSKFVFAGPSKSAETIFRYIAPEYVPVQYGGLSKENDTDFTSSDAVTEVIIKPSSKHVIELPSTEPSLIIWELRVLGWDVSYSAEFVPTSEEGYTVLVQKARKFSVADEPYVKSSFKVGEPGKIVLSIDNATTKKKKLLYRSKTKSNTESA